MSSIPNSNTGFTSASYNTIQYVTNVTTNPPTTQNNIAIYPFNFNQTSNKYNTVSIYNVAGTDLNASVPQCGVYMYNGSYQNGFSPIPIPCSFGNLKWISADGIDDGFIVYPNFGIQCFKNVSDYSTGTIYKSVNTSSNTISNVFYNMSSIPIVVSTSGTKLGTQTPYGYAGLTCQETGDVNYSTSGNETNAIKVFYKGSEVTFGPFSNLST